MTFLLTNSMKFNAEFQTLMRFYVVYKIGSFSNTGKEVIQLQ